MVGWCRNVVSKMQWQINRRRQQTYSRQISPEEASMSEMQAHLSDIGSIRDLQAHRDETETRTTKTTQEKLEIQEEKVTDEAETTKGF